MPRTQYGKVTSTLLYLELNYLLMEDCTAIHGSGDVRTRDIVQRLQGAGLKREPSGATHKEGTCNCDARDKGTRSSSETLLPTLEGKVVAEFQPPVECAHGTTIGENAGMEAQENVGVAVADTNVGNRLPSDSPANASIATETYNRCSQAVQMGIDLEEQRTTRPRKYLNSKLSPIPKPKFDADSFEDPVCDEFWKGIWAACATHNVGVFRKFSKANLPPTKIPRQTQIFRRVFHVVPDDLVTTWKHYKDFMAHHERLLKPVRQSFLP
jgi:phospholipase D1/2